MFGIGTLKFGWLFGGALLTAVLTVIMIASASAIGISQCVTITGGNGNKKMINRCPVCRVVNVERKRPGDAAPVYRKLTVPKNSRISLYFRGPGSARVVSDTPCAGAGNGKKQTESKAGTCVRFGRKGGSLVLVNSCRVCRVVLMERASKDRSRKHQSFTISARSTVPVVSKGAVSAKILNEKSCRAGPATAKSLGPAGKAAAQLEALANRAPSFKDQAVETKRSWKSLKSRVRKEKENSAEALATAKRIKAEAKSAAQTVKEILDR